MLCHSLNDIVLTSTRDYGTTRGFPNESEYTYIKSDFYNNIATYLSEVTNTNMNNDNDFEIA